MSVSGRKVLVTGAGGFIGSHLVERLLVEGARVRALVHYNALGARGWLDGIPNTDRLEIVAGDVGDPHGVEQLCREQEIIFHLAALIAIPYSYVSPGEYVRTNMQGTLNVLQAARQLGTSRVLVTSTSEVYGTARQVPIREDHPLQGQSPYSATKIGADKLAESFHLSFGTPVVTVRPFNTFGPRQSQRAVIPTIITQALAGEPIRLGALSPLRDMNFVSNTVDGFLASASHPGAIGETFNFGSGREISIGALAELIIRLTGSRSELAPVAAERLRPAGSEVERLLACSQKASTVLGWMPRVTLEDGLQRTIDWFTRNSGKYRTGEYTV